MTYSLRISPLAALSFNAYLLKPTVGVFFEGGSAGCYL
jgi:hypothetical protein